MALSSAVIAPKSCLFGHQLLFCFKMVNKLLVNNSFKKFGDATGQTDRLVPSCLYPFCGLGSYWLWAILVVLFQFSRSGWRLLVVSVR